MRHLFKFPCNEHPTDVPIYTNFLIFHFIYHITRHTYNAQKDIDFRQYKIDIPLSISLSSNVYVRCECCNNARHYIVYLKHNKRTTQQQFISTLKMQRWHKEAD